MFRKSALYISGLLIAVLTLSLSLIYSTPAQAKTLTIKAISAWPTNELAVADDYLPFIKSANKMLKEKFPGQIEIKYLGGPEVIPTKDQAEALRGGVVDMYFGTDAYYAGIAPAANCSKMTQLLPWEEKARGANAIFDEIHRTKLNATYLGRLGSEIGFQLYLNKKISKPEEIKGLRIRVSPMYIEFIHALGANPVETKPGDVYQALERNVVDGYMWPFFSIRPWGWQEVTKYVVGPSFYKVCHPILINLDTWNKIPAPIQEALGKVLDEQNKLELVRDNEKMANEHKLLEKAGMQFIEFSPQDTKKYLDLAYSSGWAGLMERAPKYAPELKKLLTK
jgi:TRAP-type transport system periplasmic protein